MQSSLPGTQVARREEVDNLWGRNNLNDFFYNSILDDVFNTYFDVNQQIVDTNFAHILILFKALV